MQEIIAQFRKELLGVATFKDKTVQNYISILYKYFDYVKKQFAVDPIKAEPLQLRQWMVLNKGKVSNSRLTHHRAALNHFYGFLQKLGIREDHPAEALFPIRRQQSDRNFMIISFLWALGLRLNELVTLRVCDFEPNHDSLNKIGLLRIHGKGDKERALFVVDKLYENLVNYLGHPQSPKGQSVPMFPNQKKQALKKITIEGSKSCQ